MNNTQFEDRMRQGERPHRVRLPRDEWIVVRVDGHGFSRLTEAHFQKPFDPTFHEHMLHAARTLLEEFQGLYAYTESDEISVLLPRDYSMFDRSHEKLISISAGIASAVFTQASGQLARFDSRVWLGEAEAQVVDYFRWRQSDATRCALNGWCYWTLRGEGKSAAAVTEILKGQTSEWKRELLVQRGIDFEKTPFWQQRGVGIRWEQFHKEGYNPITKEAVTAVRRRLAVYPELPTGDAYGAMILSLLKGDESVACS